jgi:hypothetical protein
MQGDGAKKKGDAAIERCGYRNGAIASTLSEVGYRRISSVQGNKYCDR